jgi:hypothetical protein
MASTSSVSPTKGSLRRALVCDRWTMEVMSFCSAASFLGIDQYVCSELTMT